MTYLKTVAGALAIMMASGMIADFDVSEDANHDIVVQIWSADDQPDMHLRSQLVALLRHANSGHVSIVIRDSA